MIKFIIAAILFIPISGIIRLQGTDVWYVQFLSLFSFFGLLLAWYVSRLSWQFAVLSLVSLVSVVYTAAMHPKALYAYAMLNFALLAIYEISKLNQKDANKVITTLIILFCLQSFWGIIQYLNLDPIFDSVKNSKLDSIVSFSGSPNQVGLFYAAVSPVVFYMTPYLLPLVIFGLFCSTTTSAWLGFMVVTVLAILGKFKLKQRIALITLLIIISSIYLFKVDVMNSIKIKERRLLWQDSISSVLNGRLVASIVHDEQVPSSDPSVPFTILPIKHQTRQEIKANSWLGFGLGNFMRFSPASQNRYLYKVHHRYEHAHNDLVEVFFEMGMLGFLAVVFIIVDLVVKFIRTKKTLILKISGLAILAQVITSLGIYTVHTAVSGMILVVFLGLFYGEVRRCSISLELENQLKKMSNGRKKCAQEIEDCLVGM